MAKQRIVIRVHYSVRTILEREAIWKGTTVGGLANSIIRRELEQVARQGIDAYHLAPMALRQRYLPTRAGLSSGTQQISLYLSDGEMDLVRTLVRREDIYGTYNEETGDYTYRYVIIGLLLNGQAFGELWGVARQGKGEP